RFNDRPTTDTYTLSLHDALPIYSTITRWCWYECKSPGGNRPNQTESLKGRRSRAGDGRLPGLEGLEPLRAYGYRKPDQFKSAFVDRKSTRLNSSHVKISYAVFCL